MKGFENNLFYYATSELSQMPLSAIYFRSLLKNL